MHAAYSARVEIELLIGGQRIQVAQADYERLVFREPAVLSASTGELVMRIDDHVQRWRVVLPHTDGPQRVVDARFEPS